MKRNAERTRGHILDAAEQEFAKYGFAGARVDRIAEEAKCNKRLIYAYFVNKETLFERIIDKLINETSETVPIEAENIPEFAVLLNRHYHRNPLLMRLISWYLLEKKTFVLFKSFTQLHTYRIETIKKAQQLGLITGDFSAEELFQLIISVAVLRYTTTLETIESKNDDQDNLDAVIYKAVSRLIAV